MMQVLSFAPVPLLLFGFCVLSQAAALSAQVEWPAESVEYFERNVRPLLLENCVACHSEAVGNVKGGLNMDSRASLLSGGDSGPAIDESSPEKSLLLEAVRRESLEMPPEKPLSSQQVAILEKWLKLGAPWPKDRGAGEQGGNWLESRAAQHWAWQPIQRPQVSQGNDDWVLTALDSFVFNRLQSQGIQPSPAAERHELVRRLFVDLTGLPPSPQQLNELAPDQDLAALVDQLLASPQYGVHWGRHWLDLMRYSETLGHEFDYPVRHAWRYRDAVFNAFNQDLPYDRLVAEHIAGDLIEDARIDPITGINESLASTGWWWMGDSVHAPVDVKSDWATRSENQVDVFSKTFLGMTVACARCHDHKFDAIGTSDYYGLVGVSRSIRRRYAITDPHGKIAEHRQLLQQQLQAAQPTAQEGWKGISKQSIRKSLEQSATQWRTLSAEELNRALPIGSPLYPLRLLIDEPPAGENEENHFRKQLESMRAETLKAQLAFEKWKNESSLLADFSKGLPAGWSHEAVAAQDWANAPSIDWFEGDMPVPALRDRFSTKIWGSWQPTTLRSPGFKLTNRFVCLKIRGKAAQSSVCIDGYFMHEFTGLLFGDMRKPVDQPDEFGWLVHGGDLNKYIGDPTFISLETSGDAWFELAEARIADRVPPLEPHSVVVTLLNANIASRDSLLELLAIQIGESIAACCNVCTAGSQAQPTALGTLANDASIVRALLRSSPDLLLNSAASDKIRSLAAKIKETAKSSPAPTILIACEEGDPTDAAIEIRGNPHQVGDPAPRGCFQALVPWESVKEKSSGRSELVKSLTDPRHPLVARVIVNRVWYYLMGRGIVNSPDNLGVLGSRPSHPELLDYLAVQFIENGWSIKWLVREIVLSQTYRLSSTPLASHAEQDADASLYSHRMVRRLDAEVLRDAVLLICGSLDEQLSEPSVPIHLTGQMTGRGRPGSSGPLDGQNRRSSFLEVRRNFLNPFLLAFDFPMPSTTTGKRNVSNVPAQALGLLNDPLVAEMCQRWVAQSASIASSRERVASMITAAFSRPASEAEITECNEFVRLSGESGWLDLAHTLINAKEFWYLK